MRLFLKRRWKHTNTKSIFGTLGSAIIGSPKFITCERAWKDNQPNVSCVPTGFYLLEPHDGTKYKNTFALVGSTVSHTVDPSPVWLTADLSPVWLTVDGAGVTRSACVFHKASKGSQLQGCIALGTSVTLVADSSWAKLSGLGHGKEWLASLRSSRQIHPIYLTISEEF